MESTPRSNTPNSTPGSSSPNLTAGSSASGFAPGNDTSSLNKTSSSAHSAVDEAARKAKPAIDRVAAMAHQAVDKASSAGGSTAEWLGEQTDSLKATQKKLVEDTCQYVSANPLKAIGIALVAGFVISRIV